MKQDDILALRPVAGMGSAKLQASAATANASRGELLGRIRDAEALRSQHLLTADDKTLNAAERDGQQARLAIDRLDMVLPEIRAALLAAQGRETVDALRTEAAGLTGLAAAVTRWQAEDYPVVARMIATGLTAQKALIDAMAGFSARADFEYARAEVRAVGPLEVQLPALHGPEPRALFPNWMAP